MIIDTYCRLVFTLRLIVRLIFLITRLIVIKNFNRTAALVKRHLIGSVFKIANVQVM